MMSDSTSHERNPGDANPSEDCSTADPIAKSAAVGDHDQSGNQTVPNPFDPAALRISPDNFADFGVTRKIINVRCGKPNKQEFVRVREEEGYSLDTAVLVDSLHRESYLVARSLWAELHDFVTRVRLCTAITRHGDLFLWQATLPAPDGRVNAWHDSMLQAQDLARSSWVRVQSNMTAGAYDVFQARGDLRDPEWPELSFGEIIEIAFRNQKIESADHPILKQLNGEV